MHTPTPLSTSMQQPFSRRAIIPYSTSHPDPSPQDILDRAATNAPAAAKPAAAARSASTPKYSPLHYNIQEFCDRIAPTEEEQRVKHEVIEGIRRCTLKAFPDLRSQIRVEVFGSFANGMSTWHSDVDVVVTGLFEPDRSTGCYDIKDRGRVTARLRRIAEQLRSFKKLEITRLGIISRARMPIIKLYTRRNVAADISISDSTGVLAARYMQQQSRVYPPMRPLTLLLKAYLKAQRLNDVATGGLSSYSLCNLVVAHLQEELKSGRDIFDLGEMLYSFFLRYGQEFNYEAQAVSVRSGGMVPKRSLPFAMDSARFAASTQSLYDGAVSWNERLCVDCPLSGRDVSNGTYRIDVVRQAFFRGARQLEAVAQGRSISDTSINYLSALFDAQRVLKRIYVDEDPFFKVLGAPDRQDLRAAATGSREPCIEPGDSFEDGEDYELEPESPEEELELTDVLGNAPTSSRVYRGRGGGKGR